MEVRLTIENKILTIKGDNLEIKIDETNETDDKLSKEIIESKIAELNAENEKLKKKLKQDKIWEICELL